VSRSTITQIESNLQAKTCFSVGQLDIHDSARQMKDKRPKSLAKPQGQGSTITKTQGVHLIRVRDTPVILSRKERTRDDHGNTCVY
jgi:hypothetical protein